MSVGGDLIEDFYPSSSSNGSSSETQKDICDKTDEVKDPENVSLKPFECHPQNNTTLQKVILSRSMRDEDVSMDDENISYTVKNERPNTVENLSFPSLSPLTENESSVIEDLIQEENMYKSMANQHRDNTANTNDNDTLLGENKASTSSIGNFQPKENIKREILVEPVVMSHPPPHYPFPLPAGSRVKVLLYYFIDHFYGGIVVKYEPENFAYKILFDDRVLNELSIPAGDIIVEYPNELNLLPRVAQNPNSTFISNSDSHDQNLNMDSHDLPNHAEKLNEKPLTLLKKIVTIKHILSEKRSQINNLKQYNDDLEKCSIKKNPELLKVIQVSLYELNYDIIDYLTDIIEWRDQYPREEPNPIIEEECEEGIRRFLQRRLN